MDYRSQLRSVQSEAVGRIVAEIYRKCDEAARMMGVRIEYDFHPYASAEAMERVIKQLTEGGLKVRVGNTHRISILWD